MTYVISRWKAGRFWAVMAPDGQLVCVCVYKKGANAVKALLESAPQGASEASRGSAV